MFRRRRVNFDLSVWNGRIIIASVDLNRVGERAHDHPLWRLVKNDAVVAHVLIRDDDKWTRGQRQRLGNDRNAGDGGESNTDQQDSETQQDGAQRSVTSQEHLTTTILHAGIFVILMNATGQKDNRT